jgi:transcriptional regulator with XRE-family HTH domain
MSISKEACRAARVGIGWSREELARAAGLGERTIIDFERGARDPHVNNKAAIKAALERGGVRFTEDGCICLPYTDRISE